MEKKKISILQILWKVLSWAIIIFLLIIITRSLVFKKNDLFGYKMYLIGSGSMEPTINANDAIITKKEKNLKENDIIAFKEDNIIVVHRIVKIENNQNEKKYITKGDKNNTEDTSYQTEKNIEGKVIKTIPKLGNAITFAKNHIIIIIIAIVIIIIVILMKGMIFNGNRRKNNRG